MNEHWSRWINASIIKNIRQQCSDVNLNLWVEGEPPHDEKWTDWTELRMNGPRWKTGAKNEWKCMLDINMLLLSKTGGPNAYTIFINTGIVTKILAGSFAIYKLGNTIPDDQSFITCMILKNNERENLRVNQLGQITQTTGLLRASVEGDYEGYFYE